MDEHDEHGGDTTQSTSSRLTQLEEQLRNNILQLKNKATDIEKDVEKKLSTISNNSGWKLPFLLILLILGGAAVGLYIFYQRLKKMHML